MSGFCCIRTAPIAADIRSPQPTQARQLRLRPVSREAPRIRKPRQQATQLAADFNIGVGYSACADIDGRGGNNFAFDGWRLKKCIRAGFAAYQGRCPDRREAVAVRTNIGGQDLEAACVIWSHRELLAQLGGSHCARYTRPLRAFCGRPASCPSGRQRHREKTSGNTDRYA